jgi:hypothetical protein
MIRLSTLLSLFVFSIGFISCDAPRLNPLDPQSPDFKFGQLSGQVFAFPHEALSGVNVLWENGNTLTKTDSTGGYQISDVRMIDGFLIFDKYGFSTDTIHVSWNNRKNITLAEVVLKSTVGQLSGQVYGFGILHEAIPGVNVIWNNQNILTKTDNSGRYEFNNLDTKDGYITFEKNGISKDSLFVFWNNQTNEQLNDKILKYTEGTLEGYIKTEAFPRQAIQNVDVFWKKQNIQIETDASGHFIFNNLPHENGYLYFEKDGYRNDSTEIIFDDSNIKSVEFYLNALPHLDSLFLFTTVENKYPDIQKVKLDVNAYVKDKDGQSDIDSVFIKCSELDFSKVLPYGGFSNGYNSTFVAADLKLNSLDEVIGRVFNIIVKDNEGRIFNIGGSTIKRIIKQEISILSPANGAVTNSTPTLKWNRFRPGFNFTYSVRIYTDEVSPVLVWSRDRISIDDIEIVVNSDLNQGDYFWTISCVDDFGDKAISKLATFTVQ